MLAHKSCKNGILAIHQCQIQPKNLPSKLRGGGYGGHSGGGYGSHSSGYGSDMCCPAGWGLFQPKNDSKQLNFLQLKKVVSLWFTEYTIRNDLNHRTEIMYNLIIIFRCLIILKTNFAFSYIIYGLKLLHFCIVIDPLILASLIGFIGLATFFLNQLIAMSMLMMRRRKRRGANQNPYHDIIDIYHEGEWG